MYSNRCNLHLERFKVVLGLQGDFPWATSWCIKGWLGSSCPESASKGAAPCSATCPLGVRGTLEGPCCARHPWETSPGNQGQGGKVCRAISEHPALWLRKQGRGEAAGALAPAPEQLPASLPWEKEVFVRWQSAETVLVNCTTE